MKARYPVILILSLALITGMAIAQAQATGESNALQVRSLPVDLRDDADRKFDTAKLSVTLAAAPGYENGQTLSKGPVQFNVADPEGKSYPVEDGQSNVALLTPGDAQSQPFKYNFSAKGSDGEVYVTDLPIEVDSTMPRAIHLRARMRAPVRHDEVFGGIIFSIIAIVLILVTFFYFAFRRMLFNRRMEVSSAVSWSNIITLLYLILASCTVLVAYLNPSILTQQAINTYIGLVVTFVGFYFLGLIVMILMTRPRAIRS
jgi:hypothetical protein